MEKKVTLTSWLVSRWWFFFPQKMHLYLFLQPVRVQLFRLRKTRRPITPHQHPSSNFYFFLSFLSNFSPLAHVFFFFSMFYLWNCFYRLHGPIHTIQQMALCALVEDRGLCARCRPQHQHRSSSFSTSSSPHHLSRLALLPPVRQRGEERKKGDTRLFCNSAIWWSSTWICRR